MRKKFLYLAFSLILNSKAIFAIEGSNETPEVTILAVWHFHTPGLDEVKGKSQDVLLPKYQKELEALSSKLATWKPDKILIESRSLDKTKVPSAQELSKSLKQEKSEIYQIGYRLASELKQDYVYPFDAPGKWYGEEFKEKAKKYQRDDILDELQTIYKDFTEMNHRHLKLSIFERLLKFNEPGFYLNNFRSYFTYLKLFKGHDYPGAKLLGAWYERNARMFSRLKASATGQRRILAIVGSGHAYYLRDFIQADPELTYVSSYSILTNKVLNLNKSKLN